MLVRLEHLIKKCFHGKNAEILFLLAAAMTILLILAAKPGYQKEWSEPEKCVITPATTAAVFGDCRSIHLLGIKVDGQFYPANTIFYGNWEEREDGSVFYDEWKNAEPKLSGVLPGGKDLYFVFQGNIWRGNVEISTQNKKAVISTYRYGETNDVIVAWNTGGHLSVITIGCAILFTFLIFLGYAAVHAFLWVKMDLLCLIRQRGMAKVILFLCSSVLLTYVISCNANSCLMYLGIIFALPFYLNLWIGKKEFTSMSGMQFILFLILSETMLYARFSSVFTMFCHYNNNQMVFTVLCFILLLPALWELSRMLSHFLEVEIRSFFKDMDRYERIFYIFGSVCFFVFILLLYQKTSGFSYAYFTEPSGERNRMFADVILGYDHSWLMDYYDTLDHRMYNAKHPWIWIPFVILGNAGKCIQSVLSGTKLDVYGMFWAFVNVQMMLASSILLKRITKNPWVSLLFSGTFFFLVMCLGGEQYQISLCMVLAAVCKYLSQERGKDAVMLSMSGMTLTSGYLVPVLTDQDDQGRRIFPLVKYCVSFFLVCCGCGAIASFDPARLEGIFRFSDRSVGFKERLMIFSNFVQWCFLSPDAKALQTETGYWVFTAFAPSGLSLVGILILLICMIVIIKRRKEKVVQIAGVSVWFSFVLCAVLGWAIKEAWLYAVLFSWAYLILLFEGLGMAVRNKMVKNIACFLCTLVLGWYNIRRIWELVLFCCEYYPV